MRILIDTNVILDIVQKREPFFADSYHALRKAIEADTECLISVSAVTDIFYLLRKAFQSAQTAKERIEQLSQIFIFADVQGVDIHTALMRSMPDFEDAVVDAVVDIRPIPDCYIIFLQIVAQHFPKSCFLWGILFPCHNINLQTGKSILHQFEGLHKLWNTPGGLYGLDPALSE